MRRFLWLLPLALALTDAAPIQAAPVSSAPLGGWAAGPPVTPNPKLTPGATLPVTKADLCVPGYSQKVRHVPESLKKKVYVEYGIKSPRPREYEVDHLISLELGGSNSIKNLWPESYLTRPWNARVKDGLENRLHSLVCKGKISLPDAQKAIAADWIAAYKKYVGPKPVAPHKRRIRPRVRHPR